jgi:hypothetical protein
MRIVFSQQAKVFDFWVDVFAILRSGVMELALEAVGGCWSRKMQIVRCCNGSTSIRW